MTEPLGHPKGVKELIGHPKGIEEPIGHPEGVNEPLVHPEGEYSWRYEHRHGLCRFRTCSALDSQTSWFAHQRILHSTTQNRSIDGKPNTPTPCAEIVSSVIRMRLVHKAETNRAFVCFGNSRPRSLGTHCPCVSLARIAPTSHHRFDRGCKPVESSVRHCCEANAAKFNTRRST